MPARCSFVPCSMLWFRRLVKVQNGCLNLNKAESDPAFVSRSYEVTNVSISVMTPLLEESSIPCLKLSLSLCFLYAVAEIQDVVSKRFLNPRFSIVGPRFRI